MSRFCAEVCCCNVIVAVSRYESRFEKNIWQPDSGPAGDHQYAPVEAAVICCGLPPYHCAGQHGVQNIAQFFHM